MAMRKSTITYLLRYLMEHTDEEHPATAPELERILKEAGQDSDRRTIRKDIEKLKRDGYDLVILERNGVMTRYYYAGEKWEPSEVRVLIDAVSSAQFITARKTGQMIRKLAGLAGEKYRRELTPGIIVSQQLKAENPQILRALEKISEAIRTKKKISFKYYNYGPDRKRVYRHDGEVYVLSPYGTVWKEDRYYIVGWSDKRDCIVSFRLDRMPVPRILEEAAVPAPEDFKIRDYVNKFTRMYGGREETVTLRCRREMTDKIIDRFGKEAAITNITETTFDVTASVAVGGTFLAWLFQYAGSIVLLGPDSARALYQEMLTTAGQDMALGTLSGDGETGWKLT